MSDVDDELMVNEFWWQDLPLPPKFRVILTLRAQGHRYSSIARLLGVPLGTARSRLHYARLYARRLLVIERRNNENGRKGQESGAVGARQQGAV